jgi:hypothetical protein
VADRRTNTKVVARLVLAIVFAFIFAPAVVIGMMAAKVYVNTPRPSISSSPVHEGEVVVNSLSRYREQFGMYPNDIEELKEYGLPVPSPVWKNCFRSWNDEWEYRTKGDEFELEVSFGDRHYPVCWYKSDIRKWRIDFGFVI